MQSIKKVIIRLIETMYRSRKVLLALSCLVVFVVTYVLILPAFTLEKDEAAELGGIDVPGVEAEEQADAPEASEEKSSDKSAAEKAEPAKAAKQNKKAESTGNLTFEGDGFTVAVDDKKSVLPGNTEVVASELLEKPTEGTKAEREAAEEAYKKYYELALDAVNEETKAGDIRTISFVKFYDIALQSAGEELQPSKPVNVTIAYDEKQQKDMRVEEKGNVKIVHFSEDKDTGEITAELLQNKSVDVALDQKKMAETTFEAEGFSVYAVVYTVDLHYEVNGETFDFSFKGGGAASLRELIKTLNVADSVENESGEKLSKAAIAEAFLRDVDKVEFSDESLVKVAKVEESTTAGDLKASLGLEPEYSAELTEEDIAEIDANEFSAPDWALISLKPFESDETLTITMKNGDVWTVKVTDAMDHNKPYEKGDSFTAYDTRLDGFTINLFDYGPESSLDAGGNNIADKKDGYNSGINDGHELKFTAYGRKPSEEQTNGRNVLTQNHFSGTDAATQGIVSDTLSGGYPSLNVGNHESLGYLFNTNADGENKKVFKNVSGLFQKDVDGKYVYDSNINYAYYDPSQGDGGNFVLCDTFPEEGDTASIKQWGVGFFPFNQWNGSKDCIHWKDYCPPKGGTNNNYYYNHHFGMTLDGVFQMTPNGKLNGHDMEFNFSGDDDLWVFIDDVLVLDIGGIHNPVGGKINFNTGEVTVNSAYKVNTIINDSQSGPKATTSIAQRFSDAGKTWDPSPYVEHTIKVFYVERGGCYSNCQMEFNLTRFADVEFDKEDQYGDPVENAEFRLFKEDNTPLMETYVDHEDNNTVKQKDYVRYSDDNGHIKFDHVPVGTYLVKEMSAPDGYVKDNATLVAKVYVDKNEDGSTSVVRTVLLRNGSETDKVENIKKEDITVSLEKQWKENGKLIEPPRGTTASFNLIQVKTVTEEYTYTPEKKKATVRLLGKNEQSLCNDLNVEVGDTIKIGDYQLGYSNNNNTWNPSDHVLLNGKSIGTLQTWHNYGIVTNADPITYVIKEDDIDGNGQVVLRLESKNRGNFDDRPDLSIASKGAPLDPVTGTREKETSEIYESFELPDGDAWSKSITVPKYGDDGSLCSYYFEEISDSGSAFDITYVDGSGNEIQDPSELKTNTDSSTQTIINNIHRRNIKATKEWDPKPPAGTSITVELYKDGIATGDTIVLDGTPDENGEDEAWVANFIVLEDGDALYTVQETGTPSGYSLVSINSDASSGVDVGIPVSGLAEGNPYYIVEGNKALAYNSSTGNLTNASITKQGNLITTTNSSAWFTMTADGNGFRIHPYSAPSVTLLSSYSPWQYIEGNLKVTSNVDGTERFIHPASGWDRISRDPCQVELYKIVRVPKNGDANYTLVNKRVEEPVTADISIIKTDSSNNHAIGGAVFKLTCDHISVIPSSDNGIDFSVTVSDDGTFTVPEEGVSIMGLPVGSYAIEEVSAPEGYIITERATEFVIEADGSITGKERPSDDEPYVFEIPNPPGAELPHTGGIGTTIFYILGSLLVIGSAVVLISRRRIRK